VPKKGENKLFSSCDYGSPASGGVNKVASDKRGSTRKSDFFRKIEDFFARLPCLSCSHGPVGRISSRLRSQDYRQRPTGPWLQREHLMARRKANVFYHAEREETAAAAASETPAGPPAQDAAAAEIRDQRLCRLREVAG